jgi:hypothetical protein
MSNIIVNGIRIEGSDASVMHIMLAISAVAEAGETRTLVFTGDQGKTCILVNPSTQAQATLTDFGPSVVADALTDNADDILAYYRKTDSSKDESLVS